MTCKNKSNTIAKLREEGKFNYSLVNSNNDFILYTYENNKFYISINGKKSDGHDFVFGGILNDNGDYYYLTFDNNILNVFKNNDIDLQIEKVSQSIQGTNTKLIIVADHGLLNIPKTSEIWLEGIPGLEECLTVPIVGEPRVRDCFVRPRKIKDFEKIIKTKMSEYCWCFKGEQLISDNLYGLGKPNKKLFDRVGDYVLIMKKDYVLKDHNDHSEKGFHGAFSDDEMFVPLITIDC